MIRLRVSGNYACFTRPEMKVERVSYDVMTPSAARGILEAIHWKPAIRWIVDEIRVLKPIRFQSIRRNELGASYQSPRVKIPTGAVVQAMQSEDLSGLPVEINAFRQQRASTVLVDVDYVISARFELTPKADDSDNPGASIWTSSTAAPVKVNASISHVSVLREWLKDSEDAGMIALLRFQESWDPHHFDTGDRTVGV
jgi:CRISPR-associated Cas5-like protein